MSFLGKSEFQLSQISTSSSPSGREDDVTDSVDGSILMGAELLDERPGKLTPMALLLLRIARSRLQSSQNQMHSMETLYNHPGRALDKRIWPLVLHACVLLNQKLLYNKILASRRNQLSSQEMFQILNHFPKIPMAPPSVLPGHENFPRYPKPYHATSRCRWTFKYLQCHVNQMRYTVQLAAWKIHPL